MPLSDYTDIMGDIEDAPEPCILPRGTEVKARIIRVDTGQSDKWEMARWYNVTFDVPDQPEVIEFKDFFWDLAESKGKISEKQYQRTLYRFRTFAKAFDIDYSKPLDWTQHLDGKEGFVILGIKSDPEWGDKNSINKYTVPK